MSYPSKRRRTATSVLAGDFDLRPQRDVLTSLLNGVPMPKPTEEELQARRDRKREKRDKIRRERERERAEKKRVKAANKSSFLPSIPSTSAVPATAPPVAPKNASLPIPRATTSAFWQARPQIVIPMLQRSASFSPPPMPSSPPTTPGPSISSRTSATSSKRPFTPDDGDDITDRQHSVESDSQDKKPRKKRPAARKGWKGWVEGSPPPSEKLINLDVVTVLAERKTRSGKSFDAIGAGRDGWV